MIQSLSENIQIQAKEKHAEKNMNGNILTPSDTARVSLKDELICNTYTIELIYFSIVILNIPRLPIAVILKDTELGVFRTL